MRTVFAGIMSGTSLDGVDGVLVDFGPHVAATGTRWRVLAHAGARFEPSLERELLALNASGHDEVHRGALASNALARIYAGVTAELIAASGVGRDRVAAIGCHGQTVRHRPGEFDGTGYTVQLNAPALLAELSGIDVVADFRSRDVAAGGQGAPLVPAFHRAAFATAGEPVAVLNLGGISNLTAIAADGATIGFDCGPANGLLDAWCAASTGRRFDDDGAFAATGSVDAALLDGMRDGEPYFSAPPPKSTGRDRFNAGWLERQLAAADARRRLGPADVQATLAELVAATCADACRRYARDATALVVCGGGAFNGDLMRRLARRLAPVTVIGSGSRGLPPDQVEAVAFAWLAKAHLERRPGNVADATGAAGPRVLGALYPAG